MYDYLNVLLVFYLMQVVVILVLLYLSTPAVKIFEDKRSFLFSLIPYIFILNVIKGIVKKYNSL